MRWALACCVSVRLLAAGAAADAARAVRENGFDLTECYRVRDLSVVRGDVRIYFTDGYLLFGQPVAGRRLAAVFTTDVEGGDGEVIVMPPNKGERRSLAAYTGSPTLNEHFRAALFLGASGLDEELIKQMSANPANRKVPEMAPLIAEQWAPVLRNLTSSYETRLVLDLVANAPPAESLMASLFNGVNLGNFDVVWDPRASETITIGQVGYRENRAYFDVWTSFEPRNLPRSSTTSGPEVKLDNYRIEATVTPDLELAAVTRVTVRPGREGLRAVVFDITRNMLVETVTVDGQPAEVLQRDALRANLGRSGNEIFLVVPNQPLRAGRDYEFEFHHHGKVIHSTGDHVYYVAARGNWYPTYGLQYARYDLKFRYPQELDMVSAGEVVEDSRDGTWRTTRRRTQAPIRVAGFNLGSYLHTRTTRSGYTVEVYANRSLEAALQPKLREPVALPQVLTGRRSPVDTQRTFPQADPAPTAADRLRALAADISSALEFMAGKFGPPALPFLTVAPIAGTFGQGFPGLIYLSTLAYLKPGNGVRAALPPNQEVFYADLLQVHETAHQWWGNVVSSAGYRDQWLMEALANYSALLYLERRKGIRALDLLLDQYRADLLAKSDPGTTVEETGPLVLGARLETSAEPRAWRSIIYGKGSWILHMLRRQMGDERFYAMLAELRRKYERQDISSEEFRQLAARFLPPKSDDPKLEAFFDQWIYGTGIPTLKLHYTVKGKAPSLRLEGTVTQTALGEHSTVLAPIEIQFARGQGIVHWVRTSNEPEQFTVALRQMPTKVALDPRNSVLRRP